MGCMLESVVQWKCPIVESYKEIRAFIVQCYPPSLAPSVSYLHYLFSSIQVLRVLFYIKKDCKFDD